ncbi:sensor histidine kinase [Limibaculum sp. M0105]|uniref:Sensor histidine kinase n=1 Tax=Thermohalobaculum xanthum TaxID=2753746 RepID=A0A8J7M4D1_9RHOB|nr:sensor histidine kinase [Thermohalobaculum xanthum]MBK0398186.1 sensor histidine kinase [Thermohalobaculum xanthum]
MRREGRSLVVGIALRILLVGTLCLGIATLWLVRDTAAELRRDAQASAQRVAELFGSRTTYIGLMSLSIGGVAPSPVFYDWQDYPAPYLIAPGVCVEFGQSDETKRRRCGAWDPDAVAPPAWFSGIFAGLLDAPSPARVEVIYRNRVYGEVTAHLDPTAAHGRAWSRVRVLLGVALVMTTAIGGLSALVIWHALLPFRQILHGLRAFETGDFSQRLPLFRALEFRRLARAYNDIASALARGRDERKALTRKLFSVQENERRMIARELHDQFGQCLTATRAIAAAIERRADPDDAELAEDARTISQISADMMDDLKRALFRLRPPELDQLGLELALTRMVNGWRARSGGTRFTLSISGDCNGLAEDVSLSVYRIVQECLTNAMRHGAPSQVSVSVTVAAGGLVRISVADDGGGAVGHPQEDEASGFGLLGIRERVEALGGETVIEQGGEKFEVVATIPPAQD